MRAIELDQFLAEHFPSRDAGADAQDVTELLTATRRRELMLRRFLPDKLVRRLDRGFARSNTVHPQTATALYRLCRASCAAVVYETGTYWGYSTSYLALALDGRPGAKVYSFDLDARAGGHIPRALRSRVELVRGQPSTATMPAYLARIRPDMFFQDSRHDYEGVRDELRQVVPHLRRGALVLFHDFVLPDVRRAAEELLGEFDLCQIRNDDPQQLGVAVRRTAPPDALREGGGA